MRFPEGGAHQTLGRLRPRVEENRADDGLANIAENGVLVTPARLRLALAKPNERPDLPLPRDFGAGLLAHERGETAGQQPLALLAEGADQHMRDAEPKHAVAEKLQSLVGIRSRGHRADMSQRAPQQASVLETMTNPRLETG